jgi:predicted aldo/keto reductase-like oxidoreductase
MNGYRRPRPTAGAVASEGGLLRTRRLGDREVGAIGLGAMPMSLEGRPDRDRAVATIHCALDLGVTLIDTADELELLNGASPS